MQCLCQTMFAKSLDISEVYAYLMVDSPLKIAIKGKKRSGETVNIVSPPGRSIIGGYCAMGISRITRTGRFSSPSTGVKSNVNDSISSSTVKGNSISVPSSSNNVSA